MNGQRNSGRDRWHEERWRGREREGEKKRRVGEGEGAAVVLIPLKRQWCKIFWSEFLASDSFEQI
jgi:hypothetical protein